LIDIIYKIKIEHHYKSIERVKDFSSFNVKMFLRELDSLDWIFLYYANINSKVETFNKLLLNCYDNHAPFKIIQSKDLLIL